MSQAVHQHTGYTEKDYENLPEDIRAELVDGQLYDMAAPSRLHQELLNALNYTIYHYLHTKNARCRIYPAPFAVKLSDDSQTIVEPDLCIICDPKKLTEKGCSGAPDWIIEIVSPGNPEHDYIDKLRLYKNAGVREYWIVDPQRERIFVYYWEQEKFEVEMYTFQDTVKVTMYEDLQIDFKNLDLLG